MPSHSHLERLVHDWISGGMSEYHRHFEFAIVSAPIERVIPIIGAWFEIDSGHARLIENDVAEMRADIAGQKMPPRNAKLSNGNAATLSTPLARTDITVIETRLDQNLHRVLSFADPALTVTLFYSHFNVKEDFEHGIRVFKKGKLVRKIETRKGTGIPGKPWNFTLEGDPEDWEKPDDFAGKHAKHRVTREKVIACANRLGVDIYRDILSAGYARSVRMVPNWGSRKTAPTNSPFRLQREGLLNAGVRPSNKNHSAPLSVTGPIPGDIERVPTDAIYFDSSAMILKDMKSRLAVVEALAGIENNSSGMMFKIPGFSMLEKIMSASKKSGKEAPDEESLTNLFQSLLDLRNEAKFHGLQNIATDANKTDVEQWTEFHAKKSLLLDQWSETTKLHEKD